MTPIAIVTAILPALSIRLLLPQVILDSVAQALIED